MERPVQRLDGRPRGVPAALGDAADAPALLGELLAARQVDAGELEEADAVRARVDVDLRSRDEALEERRPEDGVLAAHRIRQPQRVGLRVARGQAPRVRLREAGADEDVLDDPAEPLERRQVTGDRTAERHRVRHAVEHRPRDLLDEVDLTGHVARTPRRDGHLQVVGDLEAEAGRGSRAARPRARRGRSGGSRAPGGT